MTSGSGLASSNGLREEVSRSFKIHLSIWRSLQKLEQTFYFLKNLTNKKAHSSFWGLYLAAF